jgi:hypothetical protein
VSALTAAPALTRRQLQRFSLIGDAPLRTGEVLVAGSLLCVVGAGVFAAHVIHGGLYADDWALGSLYMFPTHGGALSSFLHLAPARPVQAVYLFLTFALLGTNAATQLSVALALGVLASTMFYLVLRTLGVVRLHAWLISALALLFPASDATKLWADASPGMLSVSFYCAGLLLALRAFRRSQRRPLLTHAASLAFYALSIMTYETTAPLIAVSAPLFCRSAPRREVIRRTLADAILVALILRFVTSRTGKTVDSSLGPMLKHGKAIFDQGSTVFSQSLFPFYSVPDRRMTLLIVLVVVLSGIALFRMLGREDRDRELLGHAMAMIAAGVCVAIAGWAILIPANIGYSPMAGGDGTRINDVAAFGIVLCVFGLLLALAVLVFRGLARSRTLAAVAASVGALVVGAGYTYRVAGDIGRWDSAATIRSQVLSVVHRSLPRLTRSAAVFVTGFTEEPYENIGSFDFPWDLKGAVQVTYADPSLLADPVLTPAVIRCGPTTLTALVGVAETPIRAVPYGPAVYLVSYRPRYLRVVTSRRACLALGGTA